MQEFPNFQNLQFGKNTKFSKFSKEIVATIYTKNRQKNFGWNSSDLWRFGKY
jgi:hypothetical protein